MTQGGLIRMSECRFHVLKRTKPYDGLRCHLISIASPQITDEIAVGLVILS